MNVLQLISSGGLYGAETVILNLARGLEQTGHRSVLGVFANGDTQLHHVARARHLESHLLPCAGQFDRRMITTLRHFVREHSIDVVHAHGYKADVYAYFAFRKAGVPLVSTCHNWLDNDLKVRAYGALDRMVLRRFHAVAVVSTTLQATLLASGVDTGKLHLIPNGIDIEPFQKAAACAGEAATPSSPHRVGVIGRLSPEKGIDLFLQAAAAVLRHEANVRFLIAGDGPEREALEALAAELEIRENVVFLGRIDTMPEFLASLDLVVSASRFEGLPMTILESMASGRPIIATTVGEIPSVLDGGHAGVLVAPEESGVLAGAIVTLLQNPELRRMYAQRAAQRVADAYSAARMTARYLDLYSSC